MDENESETAPEFDGEGQVALDTEVEVPASEPEVEPTSVDALEGQLNSLQKAMDQLQRGDLDEAEATIAALESEVAAVGESSP